MRLLRFLLGSIFLLLALCFGALAYVVTVLASKPPLVTVPVLGTFPAGYLVGALAAIWLVLAIVLLPFGKARKPKQRGEAHEPKQRGEAHEPKQRGEAHEPKQREKTQPKDPFKENLEQRRANLSSPAADTFRSASNFESAPLPSVPAAQPEQDTKENIEKDMQRLVAVGQRGVDLQTLLLLLNDYYPELAGMVKHLDAARPSTIETIGGLIIEIARHKVKMRDPNLSDNQFSNFQAKAFEGEQRFVAQIYKPAPDKQLSPEQAKAAGLIFDKRDWESAQRRIRGDRTDWQPLSLANAKDLIG